MIKILKKEKNQKSDKERLSESKRKLRLQALKVDKALNKTKQTIDESTNKAREDRAKAISAIERGDELEARMLSSMIRTSEISLSRNTSLYKLLLKVKQALESKLVCIEIENVDTSFDFDLDPSLTESIDKLVSDIKSFELTVDIMNEDIDSITEGLGSDKIFDELVREVKNKNAMSEHLDASNDLAASPALQSKLSHA